MKILAVVPARGGSKGVPNKNILPIAGKPMIEWTIAASRNAPSVSRLIVSTDSPAIAEAATRAGAEVPFLRPAELARDDTPGAPPLLHALDWLRDHENYEPDYALLLQPTSPLRTEEDIEGAIRLAREKNADSVVSLTPSSRHPHWAKRITPEGWIEPFLPATDAAAARRQDLPQAFDLNGAIYLIRPKVLRQFGSWYPPRTFAWVMPQERSLDIDTPWDLRIAGWALSAR